MSDPYEEILEGETCLRLPLSERHEAICQRLHSRVTASMAALTIAKLLPARSLVQLSYDTKIRPDLALVTAANNKLWLVAEIVNSGDHNPDTVVKKTLYEQVRLPRLWMVDPRYNNVEIYHGSPQGMVLKHILALKDVLTEPLLPKFEYGIDDLFKL